MHLEAAHRIDVARVAGAPAEGPLVLLVEQRKATDLFEEPPQRVAPAGRHEGVVRRARRSPREGTGGEHLADQGVIIGRGVVLVFVRRIHCARGSSTIVTGGQRWPRGRGAPSVLSSGSGWA